MERVKELNRIRAKRYYDNNKEKILFKRKNKVETKVQTKVQTNPNSKAFYDKNIKSLNRILGNVDFNDYTNIIDKINNATHNNKPYGINTIKNFYQTILYSITNKIINVNIDAFNQYKREFELYKIKSSEIPKANIVMPFEEYLPIIKQAYGENSKEFIIAYLYSVYSFRDDLQLKIADGYKNLNYDTENYIVIHDDKCIIYMNTYKTAKKYGRDKIVLDNYISNLIRTYIYTHKLKDYLFSDKNLSYFIKRFNNKLGLPITINTYRQMFVSEHQSNIPQDKLELSKIMKHSPSTTKLYIRGKERPYEPKSA